MLSEEEVDVFVVGDFCGVFCFVLFVGFLILYRDFVFILNNENKGRITLKFLLACVL